MMNDYNVANKNDFTWQIYFMLKLLNQNIIDEMILITLKTSH